MSSRAGHAEPSAIAAIPWTKLVPRHLLTTVAVNAGRIAGRVACRRCWWSLRFLLLSARPTPGC